MLIMITCKYSIYLCEIDLKTNLYTIIIMSNYKCGKCNYTSNKKCDMDRHIVIHNKQEIQIPKKVGTPRKKSQMSKEQTQKSKLIDQQIAYLNIQLASQIITHIAKTDIDLAAQLLTHVSQMDAHLVEQLLVHNEIQSNQVIQKNNQLTIKSDVEIQDNNRLAIKTDGAIQDNIKLDIPQQTVSIKQKKIVMTQKKYIMSTYQNAPELKSLLDYSIIKDDQDVETFIKRLIYNNEKKRSHIFIGDLLVQIYKKNDPTQQSLWADNLYELTFIVSNGVINDKTEWYVDKKGIRTTEYIIKPLIDYIEMIGFDYRNDHLLLTKKKHLSLFSSMLQVFSVFRKKEFNRQVLKYIAPNFDSLKLRNQYLHTM